MRAKRLAAALSMSAALLTASLATLSSSANAAPSSGSKTFSFTGGEQAFSVPDGVTSLDVTAVGGKGATGVGGALGGMGAAATGKMSVTPGQILFIEVGSNGGSPSLVSGGFNGGGRGGATGFPGGGGGGATDIRTISKAAAGNQRVEGLNSRVVIAGGGGGGGGFGMVWANQTTISGTFIGGPGGQAGLPALNGNGSDGQNGSPKPDSGGLHGGDGGVGGKQVTAPHVGTDNEADLDGGGDGLETTNTDSGSAGGGGGGFRGGDGGYRGGGPNTRPPGGGSGGGGGAGSSHFASTVTNSSVTTDTSGVPQLRISYKVGNPDASGLKFGKVKLNKKKGTAILPVTVPGTGTLSIGGKGLVHKRPSLARAFGVLAKKITQAGTYKLKVKAKGKKRSKLFDIGKVKVKAVVTFKPTSGDAVHDSRKITLKKS